MVMWDYRTLTQATQLIVPPPSLLLDEVFKTKRTFPTETVEFDELEALQLLLPESSLDASAPYLSAPSRRAKTVTPPVFKAKEAVNARDLFQRALGQTPYIESVAPAQQGLEAEVARRLQLLKAARRRREEVLCAKALQGSVAFRNVTVDYGIPADHKFSGTANNSWKGGRNPFTDIKAWQAKVGQDVGVAPTLAICGPTAANLIMQHADFQRYMHTFRVDIGRLEPVVRGPARLLGNLWGIQIWEYFGGYHDDTGAFQTLIPDDSFILLAPEMEFEIWYGAVPLIEVEAAQPTARLFQGEELVMSYRHPDASVQQYFIELATRPIPVIRYPKAIFVATNLNA